MSLCLIGNFCGYLFIYFQIHIYLCCFLFIAPDHKTSNSQDTKLGSTNYRPTSCLRYLKLNISSFTSTPTSECNFHAPDDFWKKH